MNHQPFSEEQSVPEFAPDAPVDLCALLRDVIETRRTVTGQAGHEFVEALPLHAMLIAGDVPGIVRLLTILLDNAASHTEPGGCVSVTIHEDNIDALVSVRHHGNAFPQEDPDLPLAYHLAELHGGSLEIRNDGLTDGKQFVLRLPLVTAQTPTDIGAAATADTPLSGRRILVVDDNRDAADTLAMLLNFLGAEVGVERDGHAALERLAQETPDAVLLDISMPEMDGYEVARRIRSRPELKDVMLIALTGWGQDSDRGLAEASGFNHHLVKPVDLGMLEALLRAASA
jgi:CheY-like chemotaxis protein